MMAGKVVSRGFEIKSNLNSYFLMTVKNRKSVVNSNSHFYLQAMRMVIKMMMIEM